MFAIAYFVLLVLLWVTRYPGVEGWSRFISPYVDDSTPAVLIVILALVTPFAWQKNRNGLWLLSD